MVGRKEYYELQGFENAYLEDSYVLNVLEKENEIEFVLDVVLTENHPLFTTPRENEQYCYKRGRITFTNVIEYRSTQAFVDAHKEIDYGNIDEFFEENGNYHLSGDWGKMMINSSLPEMLLDRLDD